MLPFLPLAAYPSNSGVVSRKSLNNGHSGDDSPELVQNEEGAIPNRK